MDRLTLLVVSAQLRLRLEYLARHPEILKDIEMDKRSPLTIPRPVELAGMRSRLLRAQRQQQAIAKTGEQYDAVMDGIDEAHQAIKGHVGDLDSVHEDLRRTIEKMIERPNGGPTDGESDGRQLSSGQREQPVADQTTAEPAASWGAKS